MTNTSLLMTYIDKSGYKMSYIADILEITRQALSMKVNNRTEFKASEIESLCNLLNISISDRMSIFFAN